MTGIVDSALADSIEALLEEPRIRHLPRSADPKSVDQKMIACIAHTPSAVAPVPYMLAIFMQETEGQHFAIPQEVGDDDSFLVVGLDINSSCADEVKSRGYGVGQYTLFHHPPRVEEVADLMLDPLRNAQGAFAKLREKLDHFVVGNDPETRADDRKAEHPLLALRLCHYSPDDRRYMLARHDCARRARKVDIKPTTPLYHLASQTYGDAEHYRDPSYVGVPDRADFQCDWPYAVRRYNGSGPDSFNYQAKVLLKLLIQQQEEPGANV
ncbi:MAG: hypothetical protein ABSC06_39700 [Rhodopila sp.]